jgi:hypothetical protein
LLKINRPTNKSYFVSVPVVFVEAMEMEKGKGFEWIFEDKNTLLFQRVRKKGMRKISS